MVHTETLRDPCTAPISSPPNSENILLNDYEKDDFANLHTFQREMQEFVTGPCKTVYYNDYCKAAFTPDRLLNSQEKKMIVRRVHRDGTPWSGDEDQKWAFVHFYPIETVKSLKDQDTEHDNVYRGLETVVNLNEKLQGSQSLNYIMDVPFTAKCGDYIMFVTDYLPYGTLQDWFDGKRLCNVTTDAMDTIQRIVSHIPDKVYTRSIKKIMREIGESKVLDDLAHDFFQFFSVPPRNLGASTEALFREAWWPFVYHHFGQREYPVVDPKRSLLHFIFDVKDPPHSEKLHYLHSPEACAREIRATFHLSYGYHLKSMLRLTDDKQLDDVLVKIFQEETIAEQIVCLRHKILMYIVKHDAIALDESEDISMYLPDDVITDYMNMLNSPGELQHPLDDPTNRIHFFKCLFKALSEIHNADYCHLDLSPGNIAIRSDCTPCIIDFNASKKMQPVVANGNDQIGASPFKRWHPFPTSTHPFGTGHFKCPAYANRKCNFGVQRDMWALGMILAQTILFDLVDCHYGSYQQLVEWAVKNSHHTVIDEGVFFSNFFFYLIEINYSRGSKCINWYAPWTDLVQRLLQPNPQYRPSSLDEVLPILMKLNHFGDNPINLIGPQVLPGHYYF